MGLSGLPSIELGDNGFKLVHSSSIDDRGLDDVTWFDASTIATVAAAFAAPAPASVASAIPSVASGESPPIKFRSASKASTSTPADDNKE